MVEPAEYTGPPTRQFELDYTEIGSGPSLKDLHREAGIDHTDHTHHTDHTDHLCGRCGTLSGNYSSCSFLGAL